VEVPAKKIPYFKPSKELKDVVNNSASVPAQEPSPSDQMQTP
jgi:integration host factor subunit beta